jgi:tol-pal system protein YbgF
MLRRWAIILTAAAVVPFGASLAMAQTADDIFAPVAGQETAPTQKPAKPLAKPKIAVAAPKVASAAAAPASGSDERIGQLEAQIADMQVVVGTMESMTRGGKGGAAPAASAGASAAGASDLDVRVGRLENQMQSLGGQIADLSNQLRLMNGKSGANAPGLKPMAPAAGEPDGQQGALQPKKPAALAAAANEQAANADTGFGETTVVPDNAAPAKLPSQQAPLDAQPDTQVAGLGEQPAAPTTPQETYDVAYGHVLQQDYAGAEAAFKDYLARFPQTPLASNAQYWLGQSFYARGQYKPAADAFLAGYKNHRTGQKAPDSLLKVAMSLARLGQKDTACSAFNALDTEFPNASAQIKRLAQSERDRVGCQPAG